MTHASVLDSVPKGDPVGFWHANGNLNGKEVARFVDISTHEAAKIAHIKTKSVRFDDRMPRELERHLRSMANICTHVAEYFDSDLAKTKLWLETPNPALGDISPKTMMRFGKYKKLLKFVLQAKQG